MSRWYFSSGCELCLLTHQADLQHADTDDAIPTLVEELGPGDHGDVWLLSGTLCVTFSILFWLLCSTWGMLKGHHVALTLPSWSTNYLSAQWRGSALQPGHSAGVQCQSALLPGLGKSFSEVWLDSLCSYYAKTLHSGWNLWKSISHICVQFCVCTSTFIQNAHRGFYEAQVHFVSS